MEEQKHSYIGTIIEFLKDTPCGYLVHYAAPYTGAGNCVIPTGAQFTLTQSMNDTCFYMHADNEQDLDWVKAVCENERENCGERLKGRFGGISFFVSNEILESDCIRFIVPPSAELDREMARRKIKAMGDFEFRYDSDSFGSATVIMKTRDQECKFLPTYIGRNPIWDILTALDDMDPNDDDGCELHWLSEPGCLKIEIDVTKGRAHLVVDEFDSGIDYDHVKESDWIRKIDTTMPFKYLVFVILEEAERNIRKHGIVGFSKDWCDHQDVFPMSSYLSLKGVAYEWGEDDLQTSSLEKEISILNQLLGQ